MPDNREPKVAIVGASGSVGRQLVELIGARGFAHRELKLFATESGSAETIVSGAGDDLLVEALDSPANLHDFDVAFLAIPAPGAAAIIAARPGPKLIDLSAATQSPGEAPIVAPGLTARAKLESMRDEMIFAVPHPVAHALAVCLGVLEVNAGFIGATAMIGASGGGKLGVETAIKETTDLLSGRLGLEDDQTQRGFNIFVRESERALAAAISAQAAVLCPAALAIALQVVIAPVLHGTGLAIQMPTSGTEEAMLERLRAAPGLLVEEPGNPLGVIDAVGQEAIVVSAESVPGGLALWCVFDNARLAALDALWIAEALALSPSTLA